MVTAECNPARCSNIPGLEELTKGFRVITTGKLKAPLAARGLLKQDLLQHVLEREQASKHFNSFRKLLGRGRGRPTTTLKAVQENTEENASSQAEKVRFVI